MSSKGFQPVKTLTQHVLAFEAALTVCLADPKPKAVHRLRSESRRIEAQLLLLDKLPGLPPFRSKARHVRQKLKVLRRAAGRVRDLDIHLELLARLPEAKGSSATAVSLRNDIAELSTAMQARRERRAARLTEAVRKHQVSLAERLEELDKALKPALTLRVPPTSVLAIATKAYARLEPAKDDTDDDHLHEFRKAAKLTRYLAESAGASGQAAESARRYSAMQAAGGKWHDWLELAAEAKELLGRRHPLTQLCREHTIRHRAGFLVSLRSVS